jgi:hypothetical protein
LDKGEHHLLVHAGLEHFHNVGQTRGKIGSVAVRFRGVGTTLGRRTVELVGDNNSSRLVARRGGGLAVEK